ncbi:MAG: hypothetical protein ACREAY_06070 [Nitrososphaera sp.]|uniref:hypothetical protein n=1 Tax=Nitrososphaera sp. TaxID=1971748 RepID=UPI003D6F99DA
MKRGYFVLIGGAAIFVVGIVLTVIWALPIASKLQQETSIVQGANLAAGQSQTVALQVDDVAEALSIVVSANNDEPLNAVLIDPNGVQGINATFTGANAMSAEPTVAGTYRVIVTNQGDSPTQIDVVFGHIPGVGSDVDGSMFAGIAAGAATVVAGLVVMIVGVVIVVIDRRK